MPKRNVTSRIRRLSQFRLSTLLLITAVIAVLLGLFVNGPLRRRHAVRAIRALGGVVQFEHERAAGGAGQGAVEVPGPAWARRIVGDEFFSKVWSVQLRNPLLADRLTDAGIAHLSNLRELEQLDIGSAQITDDGVRNLINLKKLRWLNLNLTNVSDRCVPHLKRLTNLEQLYIAGTSITDEGLLQLTSLPRLEFLDVGGPPITDSGVARFCKARPDVLVLSTTAGQIKTWVGLTVKRSYPRPSP